MNGKRIMSYRGHVIYKNEWCYMVAKGDGTDWYFESIEAAMEKIDELEVRR